MLVGNRGIGAVRVGHITQRDHGAKAHQTVPSGGKDRFGFLRAIQGLQIWTFSPFFARFASPQDGGRNDLHIQLRIFLMQAEHFAECGDRIGRHLIVILQQRGARRDEHVTFQRVTMNGQRF